MFFLCIEKDAQSLKNWYQLKLEFEFELQSDIISEPIFYTSGFDFPKMPVITSEKPFKIQGMNWGLIPSWVKSAPEAMEIRSTLNARS